MQFNLISSIILNNYISIIIVVVVVVVDVVIATYSLLLKTVVAMLSLLLVMFIWRFSVVYHSILFTVYDIAYNSVSRKWIPNLYNNIHKDLFVCIAYICICRHITQYCAIWLVSTIIHVICLQLHIIQ